MHYSIFAALQLGVALMWAASGLAIADGDNAAAHTSFILGVLLSAASALALS